MGDMETSGRYADFLGKYFKNSLSSLCTFAGCGMSSLCETCQIQSDNDDQINEEPDSPDYPTKSTQRGSETKRTSYIKKSKYYSLHKETISKPPSNIDLSQLKPKRKFKTADNQNLYAMSLLENESKIAVSSEDKCISIYNINNGKCLTTLSGHENQVRCIVALRNGKLATGSRDKTIRIWNLSTSICETVLQGHTDGVTSLIELSNSTLLSSSSDGTLRYWNINTGECQLTIKSLSENPIWNMTLIGDMIAYGSGKNVYIIKCQDGKIVKILKGHTRPIRSFLYLEGQHSLLTGSEDGSMRMWCLDRFKCVRVFKDPISSAFFVNITQLNHRVFASASGNNLIKLWDSFNGKCLEIYKHDHGFIHSLKLLSKGTLLSCGADTPIYFWGNQRTQ
jgi:WD40 repeat protein